MPATHDSLLDLVATIYDAAIEPSLWPEVAVEASRRLDSPYVRIAAVHRRAWTVVDASSRYLGEPQFSLVEYQTPETNPGLAFCAATPSTAVASRDSFVPDRELERTKFYQELMRPLDLWHAAVANGYSDQSLLAPIGFLRTRNQRPFDARDLEAIGALAPHFNRALRVMLQLKEMEARAEALAETNDRALTAILIINAFGRVAEANKLARVILEEADGLVIRDGALRAARSDDNARLVRLILEAAGGIDGKLFIRKSGAMEIARPSCRRPLALVVAPTRGGASSFGLSHAVTVAFADPERAPEAEADLIARLYGLTAREAAVAALLIRGRSPSEAADELAMTENTIRTHIRHIFDKTGVERLADLLRVLMQGPGVRGR